MPQRINDLGQPIGDAVPGWTVRPRPSRTPMQGRLVPTRAARRSDTRRRCTRPTPPTPTVATGPICPTAVSFDGSWSTTRNGSRGRRRSEDPVFHAIVELRDAAARRRRVLSAHRPGDGRHRSRPPHATRRRCSGRPRRDGGDVPDDATRLRRARLPPLRVEMRQPERAVAARRRSGSASASRASSARRW